MASILFNSPIPYESISEGRRKEQALAGDLAKSMMDTYYRATAQRAQREQWAEERPLREAQIASLAARADNEKAEAQLRSLAAINEARKANGMAGLAAVQEEAALNGWDGNSRAKLYNFISRNPEFAGSKEVAAVESNFEKAAAARDREEEWRTREATDIAIKRMDIEADAAAAAAKGESGKPVYGHIFTDPVSGTRHLFNGVSYQPLPEMSETVLAAFKAALKGADLLPGEANKKYVDAVMSRFGVEMPTPSSGTSVPGVGSVSPDPASPANADWGGVGIFKFLRPPPTATP